MNQITTYIITIYNVKTDKGQVFTTTHPEEIEEYEGTLSEDDRMFVNEIE